MSDPVRQRIITAARHHFFSHGFRGVTMDDLAAELGMSKKTLYTYFSAKSDLVQASVEEKMNEVDTELGSEDQEAAPDFFARTNLLLTCLRRHWDELQPPFIRDLARETPELFQRVQARRRVLIQRHFGKLLREGRMAGVIREDILEDLMIEMLIGAADALINPQKLLQMNLPAKDCLSAIVTIFLEGVITDRERRNL